MINTRAPDGANNNNNTLPGAVYNSHNTLAGAEPQEPRHPASSCQQHRRRGQHRAGGHWSTYLTNICFLFKFFPFPYFHDLLFFFYKYHISRCPPVGAAPSPNPRRHVQVVRTDPPSSTSSQCKFFILKYWNTFYENGWWEYDEWTNDDENLFKGTNILNLRLPCLRKKTR